MTDRPHIFVGSATETEELAEKIAKALKKALKGRVDIALWRQVFRLGVVTLSALQREAAKCDFAVFVWGISDLTVSRRQRSRAPRDNVVYEAGLFAGALGAQRVFVVHANNTKIPSDYNGVTTARFDPKAPDIDDIVQQICDGVKNVGTKPMTRLSGHWWQLVSTKDDKSVLSFFEVKPDSDGRSVSMEGHSWNEPGDPSARWETIATQFSADGKTLYYSWGGEGKRTGLPLYFGLGTIRGIDTIGNDNKWVTGDYSSIKRHQGGRKVEPPRFVDAKYESAETEQVHIMRGKDSKARKRLIAKMLKRRSS